MQAITLSCLECAQNLLNEAVESCQSEREPPVSIAHTIRLAIQLLEAAADVIDRNFQRTIGTL